MGRKATGMQAALLEARRRRLGLDRDRAERDARIEQTAADVLLALQRWQWLHEQLADTQAAIGGSLLQLTGEDLTLTQACELCGLSPGQGRQMVRASRRAATPPMADPVVRVGELADGSEGNR